MNKNFTYYLPIGGLVVLLSMFIRNMFIILNRLNTADSVCLHLLTGSSHYRQHHDDTV